MQPAVPSKQKSSNCSFKLLGENIKLYRFEEWMGQGWERMQLFVVWNVLGFCIE